MKLITYPDKLLEKNLDKMSSPPDKKLVKNMIEFMKKRDGVGLAANQVGELDNFFVLDNQVYINPVIPRKTGSKTVNEGCLSLPSIDVPVKRYTNITVVYRDMDFNKQEEKVKGLKARIIQHETDHLNGILILDRINKYKAKLLKKKLKLMKEN